MRRCTRSRMLERGAFKKSHWARGRAHERGEARERHRVGRGVVAAAARLTAQTLHPDPQVLPRPPAGSRSAAHGRRSCWRRRAVKPYCRPCAGGPLLDGQQAPPERFGRPQFRYASRWDCRGCAVCGQGGDTPSGLRHAQKLLHAPSTCAVTWLDLSQHYGPTEGQCCSMLQTGGNCGASSGAAGGARSKHGAWAARTLMLGAAAPPAPMCGAAAGGPSPTSCDPFPQTRGPSASSASTQPSAESLQSCRAGA